MPNSNGHSAIDRIISLLTAIILAAILAVLALLLIEFKHMTNKEKGIVIRIANDHALDVVLSTGYYGYGSSPSAPFYVQASDNN